MEKLDWEAFSKVQFGDGPHNFDVSAQNILALLNSPQSCCMIFLDNLVKECGFVCLKVAALVPQMQKVFWALKQPDFHLGQGLPSNIILCLRVMEQTADGLVN